MHRQKEKGIGRVKKMKAIEDVKARQAGRLTMELQVRNETKTETKTIKQRRK